MNHVVYHLFLGSLGICLWCDVVLQVQGFEFCVSAEAIFDWLRNLLFKFFDNAKKVDEVSERPFGCIFQRLSSEINNFMSSIIIDAWDDSFRVWELVLFKQAVESLLKNILIRNVLESLLRACQNFVCVWATLEAQFIVLASDEVVVQDIGLSFYINIVKDGICGNFLLNDCRVSGGIDVVFESECG